MVYGIDGGTEFKFIKKWSLDVKSLRTTGLADLLVPLTARKSQKTMDVNPD